MKKQYDDMQYCQWAIKYISKIFKKQNYDYINNIMAGGGNFSLLLTGKIRSGQIAGR